MIGSDATHLGPMTAFDLRRLVPVTALRDLAIVNEWRTTMAIAWVWSIIILLIVLAVQASSYWISLLAVLLIAGRQHALLVLMHDGAHRLLFPNRIANDVCSNLFLSFPLFVSTELYRRHHLVHHRYTNLQDDPDLADSHIPASFTGLLFSLLGDLVGIRSLKLISSLSSFGVTELFRKKSRGGRFNNVERCIFLGFVAASISLFSLFGWWTYYLIYWIVPMWFILPALLHLRAIGEHAGRTDGHLISFARSVRANIIERALICPMNVNRHIEHHLFPEIPFYRLAEITGYLEQAPSISGRLVRTEGYLFGRSSVIGELYFGRSVSGAPSA